MISIRLEDPDGAAAPSRAPRPVPDAAAEARGTGSGRCCATTRSRDRPAPATTGSPSSASRTAPPAAICTPGSRSATSSTIAAPRGTFILDQTRRARAADQRRHRGDPGPRHAARAGEGAFRPGDLVAAGRAQQPRPPLRRRGPRAARFAPKCARPTSATAVPGRTTSKAATSTTPVVSPHPCSPSSSHRATPRHTSAGRHPSWRRSAPAWPRWGSTPRASTPSRSGRLRV